MQTNGQGVHDLMICRKLNPSCQKVKNYLSLCAQMERERERETSGNETGKDILHLCSQLLLSRVTEPEPTKKAEEKPVKKNEPKRGSPVSSSCSHFMFHFFFFFFHLSLTPSIQKIIV